MNYINSFPSKLKAIISDCKIEEVNEGRIGDRIIKLSNSHNDIHYLKICETDYAKNEMKNERNILMWLSSKKLNVHKVILYSENTDKSYLLLSNVDGIESCDNRCKLSRNEVISICANALKKVHEVNISTIPIGYSDCLSKELNEISKNIRDNMIDVKSFKKANDNRLPSEVLSYLMEMKSIFRSDVFTHGDYCLPNVLIADDKNYGFVDWSQGGVGDIYRDIASVIKSINRNFGEEYSPLFFKYYGISCNELTTEKIRYYNVIDQFYYHRKRYNE